MIRANFFTFLLSMTANIRIKGRLQTSRSTKFAGPTIAAVAFIHSHLIHFLSSERTITHYRQVVLAIVRYYASCPPACWFCDAILFVLCFMFLFKISKSFIVLFFVLVV